MEAATKKRRGRPNVYTANSIEVQRAYNKANFPEMSERYITNLFYIQTGLTVAISLYGEDRAKQLFTNKSGRMKYQTILEQVGRAKAQDNLSVEACENMLSEAVELLEHGGKVKDIEKAIRLIRAGGVSILS